MQYNITFREKDSGIQYLISYKDSRGKWRQKAKQGFKTKREAKKAADLFLDELKKEFKRNKNLSLDYKDITFQGFKELYIDHEKLYKTANTIRNTVIALKQFEYLDDMRLIDIKNLHIQIGVDTMVKKDNSPITIKTRLAYLSAFFGSAVSQYKVIEKNPVHDIKIITDKKEKTKTALTESEFNRLVTALKGSRYYLVVLLAGTCGMRIGEILGLTRDAVDEINNTITINQQWKMLKYTEGEGYEYGLGDLKSKNSNRVVPVPVDTMRELMHFIIDNPLQFDGRVFPYGHKHNRNYEKALNIIIKKKGFNVSIHEIRHTYATKLISNGVDFKTAAYLLGHDVKMTMHVYSHVNDDMLNKTTKLINNIF